MSESIPLQVPLAGLQMDSDTAQYVGMLEGTIAALVINEVKYRTLLELLTGDSWEAAQVSTDPKALVALAVSALIKQTSLSEYQANKLISLRWDDHNGGTNPVVPQSVTSTRPDHVVLPSMSERFQSWKARQESAATNLATSGEEETVLPDSNQVAESDAPKISVAGFEIGQNPQS